MFVVFGSKAILHDLSVRAASGSFKPCDTKVRAVIDCTLQKLCGTCEIHIGVVICKTGLHVQSTCFYETMNLAINVPQ